MIKFIISGKYKFKIGKILKKKKNFVNINNINCINKIFKIKFFNKVKYIFKNKIFPINNSNIKNYKFKLIY